MAIYYVATTGNNSNPGTIGSPFQTIAKGISVMVAGDTLYIRSGTYNESIDANSQTIPTGTSWSNAPLISAYSGETVNMRVLNMTASYIKYVIFQNLSLDGQNTSDEVVAINSGVNHIRVIGCEIKNAQRQGVHCTHAADGYNEFIDCIVHHNGHNTISNTPQDHGFYLGSQHNIVDGCTIYSNFGCGVQTYNGYGERTDGNIIRNNRIYSNGTGGNAAAVVVTSGDSILVYNNLIYGNSRGIEVAWNNPTNAMIYNNTIYNNPTGIVMNADSAGARVKNNIVYQSGGITNNGSGTVLSNNLTTDPHFVNAAGGDFHLTAASTNAIDQGVVIN